MRRAIMVSAAAAIPVLGFAGPAQAVPDYDTFDAKDG
jgi:hypothetical protein